ncbi:hypothetical protein AWB78_05836 [Caballeronia calidae]|uniref:Uncharacterized protein n=1 Tax=Caballeronia calidae TaxID=1777139 RepID=A0A158DYX7_9BURK|nr:hypothetical protein [Caballeronia calidae]SAK99835.1 hypothetical protein AWB78_05836 [Caballeronia calidae]
MISEELDFSLLSLDFLFKLLKNWPAQDSEGATVRFGRLGTGKYPNYQINPAMDTPVTYRGMTHEPDEHIPEFHSGNLTNAYGYDRIKTEFDVALKSDFAALDHLAKFYKKNPSKYPKPDLSQRKIIVHKMMNGAPLEQSLKDVLASAAPS